MFTPTFRRSTYLSSLSRRNPDFVAVHVPSYLSKYDCLRGLKKNGTFLYNTPYDKEEVKKHLPEDVKKYLAENNITMFIIDATKIAEEIGLGNRTNTILQSAFSRSLK